MIKLFFDKFKLSAHTIDVQQFDNGTVPINIIGTFPDDYDSWQLYVACDGHYNIIDLDQFEGGYCHTFTESELAISGNYEFQIVGRNGDNKRHSNCITVYIPRSLDGEAEWPDLPESLIEKIEVAYEKSHVHDNKDILDGITSIPITEEVLEDYRTSEEQDAIDAEISDRLDNVENSYGTRKKLNDYLYESYYGYIDYAYAYDYFDLMNPEIEPAGCSTAIKNGLFGRNFDWVYNNQVEFIVHTPNKNGRFASVGMCGSVKDLDKEFVESGDYSDLYKIVPFCMQDGINEYGLTVSTNVVPTDHGFNESIPTGEMLDRVNGVMLCRYILDNFSTAYEAVNYIKEHVSVWFSDSLHDKGYEQHYMIADKNDVYYLEFIDNEAIYESINSHPYMTNFYLNGVEFNNDGSVYTPATLSSGSPTDNNKITVHGSGLERYNQIINGIEYVDSADDLMDMMYDLSYTRAYQTSDVPSDPYWYTEFVSGDIHCDSPVEDFADVVAAAGTRYTNRERTDDPYKVTWQTVHTVVYDINNLSMDVMVQEDVDAEKSLYLNPIWQKIAELESALDALLHR